MIACNIHLTDISAHIVRGTLTLKIKDTFFFTTHHIMNIFFLHGTIINTDFIDIGLYNEMKG